MELDFLGPLLDRPGPWASVCVDATRRAEDVAERHALMARAAHDELSAQGADEATCQAVHDALAAPRREGDAPGRAVYAASGEVVLDAPLGAAPQTDLVCWSALPRLTPLVELTTQDPACLLAYIDRTGADFELRAGPGAQLEAGGVEGRDWPVQGAGRADWSERRFHLSAEHAWRENAAAIAEELERLWQECHPEVVLLVGDPRERREVHDRLPEPVRAVTCESEHGGRAAGARDSPPLERDIAQVRAVRAQEAAEDALERYRAERARAAAGPQQIYAAEGVHALVEAAREHRIGTLLIEPGGSDLGHEVWVGPDPDQVAERRGETSALGAAEPAPARVDDALLRSAAATGAEVLRVHGPDAPTGGLGALLRWPEPAR